MEKIAHQAFLYDFYGELLTAHQRRVYEDIVLNDMSLSEIAQEFGISRQGVHDLVKRCDRTMEKYEDKLHLVERFQQCRKQIARICELTENYREDADAAMKEIREISHSILEEL